MRRCTGEKVVCWLVAERVFGRSLNMAYRECGHRKRVRTLTVIQSYKLRKRNWHHWAGSSGPSRRGRSASSIRTAGRRGSAFAWSFNDGTSSIGLNTFLRRPSCCGRSVNAQQYRLSLKVMWRGWNALPVEIEIGTDDM